MIRERFGKKTRDEATRLIKALYLHGDGSVNYFKFETNFRRMIREACTYRKIKERACNEALPSFAEARLIAIEKFIQGHASIVGLRASFQSDPRGYCVRLHNEHDTLWNTLGGPENGYGIGEI